MKREKAHVCVSAQSEESFFSQYILQYLVSLKMGNEAANQIASLHRLIRAFVTYAIKAFCFSYVMTHDSYVQ